MSEKYKCFRCYQKFHKKYNIQMHLKRKNPCVKDVNNFHNDTEIDIMNNKTVYVSGSSKYAFTPLNWACNEIFKSIDLYGTHEIGAKNYIKLNDYAKAVNSKSDFVGDRDDQVFYNASEHCPDASEVIKFTLNDMHQ